VPSIDRSSPLPLWAWVLLFWTLLTVVYASQLWLVSPRGLAEVRTQVIWQMAYYLAWAPATLLIWKVTGAWTPERLGWWKFVAFHAVFSVAVGVAHSAVVVPIAFGSVPVPEPIGDMFVTYVRARMHLQLLIYAAIVGVGQAIGYYTHYRESQVAAARLEAQLVAARLDSLRGQLQPHFLFNSLHSIASLARAGDTAGVVRLIAGLSDLLRHLLDSRVTHQPLREELALVDKYLDIHRVRFGDRLRVSVDVADTVQEASVPLLIVQPLVENSLRHGFASRIEPGTIVIRARRVADALVLDVVDDGVGLPNGWTLDDSPGTGLRNLASRLAVEFGDRQSLNVRPADGGGTHVTVTLPYETS
jgi:two-component sensor histidine kinase